MVQHMRRMREDGDLGEILVVQGTYSQDWLLYDTDWNWRPDSQDQRPRRACLADLGSHWCDMAGARHRGCASPRCAPTSRPITKRTSVPRDRWKRSRARCCSPRITSRRPSTPKISGRVAFRMGERTAAPSPPARFRRGGRNRLNLENLRDQSGRGLGPGAAPTSCGLATRNTQATRS